MKNPVEKEIVNIAAVTRSGQKPIISEKANKEILLEVLAYAMETRPNSLGCVFYLNEGRQKRWTLIAHSQQVIFLRF